MTSWSAGRSGCSRANSALLLAVRICLPGNTNSYVYSGSLSRRADFFIAQASGPLVLPGGLRCSSPDH